MQTVYEKNLQALKKNRPSLYKKLQKIESNTRYEVFTAGEAINIYDSQSNMIFYDDPTQALQKDIEQYKIYREYPFLYFFGVGNGQLIEYLLDNKKLEQLIVIEPDIELVYIVLNLIDLSDVLEKNKLLILLSEEIEYSFLIQLIHRSNAKFYIKVFDLLITTAYYEQVYFKTYKEIMQLFLRVLSYIANANGNDVTDTLKGFKQHMYNMKQMVESVPYQEILKDKNAQNAVIVSTGPSLDKQIPLLKKYADKIAILSVDASFPVLVKNGIKPDFVFSMERDEPTAKFFETIDKQDQEDIMFICASVQHKKVLNSIKTGNQSIVMRPFGFMFAMGLDDYGYLCKGMSSANMAHEFATAMGYENVTFIGQDLAFGDNLQTHSTNHIITHKPGIQKAIKNKELEEIPAYGDNGTVTTNKFWVIFKNFIEQHIQNTKDQCNTYNSTEGGAKIEGAIEIRFEDFLNEFAINHKKHLSFEKYHNINVSNFHDTIGKKMDELQEKTQDLKAQTDEIFEIVHKACVKLEGVSEEKALEAFDMQETIYLLEKISFIRKLFEKSEIYKKFLSSIAQPLIFSLELDAAKIKVQFVDNPKTNQIKAIHWILIHRYWLFVISGVFDSTIQILDDSKKLLKEQ